MALNGGTMGDTDAQVGLEHDGAPFFGCIFQGDGWHWEEVGSE